MNPATMSKLTIDLEDLRDKIAAMDKPGDNSWCELSISARVRVLLRERIKQIEQETPDSKK